MSYHVLSTGTIEVFWFDGTDPPMAHEDGSACEPGWYWWACFPGCLPDGDANGPFESEEAALADADD